MSKAPLWSFARGSTKSVYEEESLVGVGFLRDFPSELRSLSRSVSKGINGGGVGLCLTLIEVLASPTPREDLDTRRVWDLPWLALCMTCGYETGWKIGLVKRVDASIYLSLPTRRW